MRLLYLVDDKFPPFRVDVAELFARQMVRRGHTIDWLMQRGPQALDEPSPTRWCGSLVHLGPRSRRGGLPGRVLNNLLAVVSDLRVIPLAVRGRYDIIQVRDRPLASVWAWIAARLTGARFVYWMSYPYAESKLDQARNGFVPHPWLTRLKGHALHALLYRVVLRRADHVFVQSERMKQDVARHGIDPDRMTPVPMGVPAEQVGSADDARAPDTQRPLLLYLGIILRLRQTELLVRVLARVRQRYPGARLRYVGEGQNPCDREAVLAEAQRLGLQDAVEITGFLPMAQAWAHVREADICFSPFCPIPVLLSTSPTKLIEYMALAKCVVANEHPEQSAVLRDSGVGRTVAWDEQAFADEVCRLLDDPAAARAAAARGPEWVRACRTYEVIAEAVDRRYRSLLAGSA